MASIEITAGLNNSALHGNTMRKVIDIDDDDLEGLDLAEREHMIRGYVREEVEANMVVWDWKDA